MPSFSHGSKARLYANGFDLSSYIKSVEESGEIDTADSSALGDTHRKFITGQASASLSAEGMHDDASGAIVSALEAAAFDTETEVVHWHNLDTVGNFGFGMQGVETAINVSTPVSDVAAVSFEAASNTGFERVVSLRAKATSSTAGTTNGSSVDNSVGTNAGASGYLHVFTNSAGTVTAKVQHSTDDSSWADLLTFTDVTGQSSQRVETSGTVRRYLRAQIIKTGAGAVTASISASRTPYL